MTETGFETYTTETLMIVRNNLIRGLGLIGETVENGTFNTPARPKAAPASQFGALVLNMYVNVSKVLTDRGEI
jgi:hypothetical protein